MKKQMTNQSGITLIALIITVIVLLILATISITEITGDNGVLTKAHYAKQETLHANVKSKMQLAYAEYKTSIYSNGSKITFLAFLEQKGYLAGPISDTLPTTAILSPSLVEGMSEHGSFVISVANANFDNISENLTESEGRIRDVDMNDEMVSYSNNNILTQAGQSADDTNTTNTTITTEKLSSGRVNGLEQLGSGYKVNRAPDKIKYVLKCNSTEHTEEIVWSNFNTSESSVLQQAGSSMLQQANQNSQLQLNTLN